jgi:hypothetical protein
MKKIYILLFVGIALFLGACKKDKGNYDYTPNEIISVEGMEKSYTTISEKDKLVLDPKVTSTDPNASFEYLWGIYETNVQGSVPVLDTIGRQKALNYLVKQPAKAWVLVLRVTNKNTKYAQYFTANINVVTEFTRGWYVAKDDGINADLDLFLTPTSIQPTEKRENIFSLINGNKLEGKARMMNFFTAYKSTVTGTSANTRALFFNTDKDMVAINISTLKTIRNYNALFIEAPSPKAPATSYIGQSAYYLINDGQMHAIYAFSVNTGQFGARKMKDAANTPYRLSDYFLTSYLTDPYVFDETSSSFLSMSQGYGSVMTAISDDATTKMPANNNNKRVLYMGYKSAVYLPAPDYRYKITGFAIFQDKTDPALKILSEVAPSLTKMKLTNDTLKTTDMIYNASNWTLLDGDENMMYFVVNNQVWSRNLSNKFEQLQYSPPAGEEVTFIRHKKYTASSDAAFNYNYVMIGTKAGSGYKVRMFTKSSGSLDSSPAFTLEGNGIVRDVMYMTPSVAESTYANTY